MREVVGWLSDDVSSSVSAKALITRLEECELRGQPEYLGFGNAHHMAYAAGHLYLECEYSEGSQVLMTLEQAISTLNDYVIFYRLAFGTKRFHLSRSWLNTLPRERDLIGALKR
ncbi:hypothetical protein DMX06_21665 [Pseudomonas mosselii]|nr:hypothetical protein DMX06_21665 [Pseudomonas mosselii]